MRAAIQQQRNTEVTELIALLEYFYNLLTFLLEYIDPTMYFSHFMLIFTKLYVIKYSIFVVTKSIILKSGYFKNLMQTFTQIIIFLKIATCGRWTRNIITNWSGLTELITHA